MSQLDREQLEDLRYYKPQAVRLEDMVQDATAQQGVPVIHIVDDDEPFVTGISRLLKVSGYTVRGYANAGDFLLAEIPDAPGCILMDVCLPGPSGIELQCALASRPAPLPIIFMSG